MSADAEIFPGSVGADQRLAALRLTKLVATGALALCVAIFLTCRALEPRWPWLGFVRAFAEAATIGGLADWYAVVALFRRPLGLPIPHTAIIPRNKDRIADNLGRFIEVNFLAPEPVRRKLAEVDFAAMVAEWLADPRRSAGLSRFVARQAPRMLAAVEQTGLRDFIARRVLDQLAKIDVAPLAADLLGAFTEDRRHQKLFDALIRVLARLLQDEQALAAIREKIREELPSVFNLFRADAYLVKRIVASAGVMMDEARADPDHPLRKEFDRFVHGFIERLRHSPVYARRAEALKQDLLARPRMQALAGDLWSGLRAFVEQDLAADDSLLQRHLASMLTEFGNQLAADPAVRADMNAGFVSALSSFVESQKAGVSRFIADQVKGWDIDQLTRLVELNIGRDLQYIRFNGMLIGGVAGLLLHVAELLFVAN